MVIFIFNDSGTAFRKRWYQRRASEAAVAVAAAVEAAGAEKEREKEKEGVPSPPSPPTASTVPRRIGMSIGDYVDNVDKLVNSIGRPGEAESPGRAGTEAVDRAAEAQAQVQAQVRLAEEADAVAPTFTYGTGAWEYDELGCTWTEWPSSSYSYIGHPPGGVEDIDEEGEGGESVAGVGDGRGRRVRCIRLTRPTIVSVG